MAQEQIRETHGLIVGLLQRLADLLATPSPDGERVDYFYLMPEVANVAAFPEFPSAIEPDKRP